MQGASREEGRTYVEAKVRRHAVVLFGRSSCPACVSAATLLNQYEKDHAEAIQHVFLDRLEGTLQYSVSSFLQGATGRKASPFIYIGGAFAGNNVDVRKLANKRVLAKEIANAVDKVEKDKEEEKEKEKGKGKEKGKEKRKVKVKVKRTVKAKAEEDGEE